MGTHAKPRTTGRKAALGALAFGASLTGVGLIAAALDPSTAVLTATGGDEGGTTQLSGLSSPVSLELTPAADSITNLSSAPLPSTSTPLPAAATQHGTQETVSWFSKPDRSTTTARHASPSSGTAGSSGSETAVKPIVASTPTSSSGSSTGKHKVTGSGAPPTDTSGVTSAIQDAVSPVTSAVAQVLPVVQQLVSQVPIVSTLVQDTGASGTVSSLPLVGTLLGGSGDGQSTTTVPGLSTVTGLL
jgi:hypothetical protein